MVEPCLPRGQGEVQKFLLWAWDKNGLEANFKTEYIYLLRRSLIRYSI